MYCVVLKVLLLRVFFKAWIGYFWLFSKAKFWETYFFGFLANFPKPRKTRKMRKSSPKVRKIFSESLASEKVRNYQMQTYFKFWQNRTNSIWDTVICRNKTPSYSQISSKTGLIPAFYLFQGLSVLGQLSAKKCTNEPYEWNFSKILQYNYSEISC